MCDALIDQGRSIGDDPIGFKCTKPATQRHDEKDLCLTCEEILAQEPERISFAIGEKNRVGV